MIFSSFFSSWSQFRNTVNQGNRQNRLGENLLLIVGGRINSVKWALSLSSSESISPSFSDFVWWWVAVVSCTVSLTYLSFDGL